jgi:transposase, IS5 family
LGDITTVLDSTASSLLDLIVKAAKACGIHLRQTFATEGKRLRFKGGGHAHAKQFKLLGRVAKRQRTLVGILTREVRAKLAALETNANPNSNSSIWLIPMLDSSTAMRKLPA